MVFKVAGRAAAEKRFAGRAGAAAPELVRIRIYFTDEMAHTRAVESVFARTSDRGGWRVKSFRRSFGLL